ncbi:hypothetical protein, partial [Stenotrophomonas maltophilia]
MREAIARGDWHADIATRRQLGMGAAASASAPGFASVSQALRGSRAAADGGTAPARAGSVSPSNAV